MKRIFTLAFILLSVAHVSADTDDHLWVYAPANFQVQRSVDDLIALMKRSKKAGYTGVVITDFKFGRIDDRPEHFYRNLARTRAAAEEIGIELIPCVMPVGYSASILINNPDLAEGIPVRDMRFRVVDGEATPADRSNRLPGGDFEKAQRNRPAGWDWIDGFGVSTSLDADVKRSGSASLKMTEMANGNEAGNCRVVKKLSVKPWHQYVVTLWVKTENVSNVGEFKVNILTGGRALNFANLGVKPTQDWKKHHIVFNSLDNTEIKFYIGIWGGRDGSVWIDDVECRPACAINMVRRDGCPIRVTSIDGDTVYEEGRDFKRWVNLKTGRDPWPGGFHVMTPEPPIVITEQSRIKDGDELLVSFYHTVTIYDQQVSSCLIADELFTHLDRQVELIQKHFKPKRWFMQHDELRVAGWCGLCANSGKTAGELLAENVRRCVDLIRKHDPDGQILVWNDMFDPHHNARGNYYLVSSTLEGSWKGLSKDVVIVNWHSGSARKSLPFFANRGHRQIIAGYYDHSNVQWHSTRWIEAAKEVDGIIGYMYTTWRRDYSKLEEFAEIIRGN